jgi:hypothetical protein
MSSMYKPARTCRSFSTFPCQTAAPVSRARRMAILMKNPSWPITTTPWAVFSNTFPEHGWWGSMAVFVAEDSIERGVDHIDAHRTVLLCAGPWTKRNFVSHTNSNFPGLLKTVFEILHVPALDLSDASAADLSDCFMSSKDAGHYEVAPVDKRLYSPTLK